MLKLGHFRWEKKSNNNILFKCKLNQMVPAKQNRLFLFRVLSVRPLLQRADGGAFTRPNHVINTELKTEVNICRLSHTSTFAKAYMYLYTLVVRIYPYTNHSSGKFINHCIYATGHVDWSSGRCGCFNGLGHGPGGEVRVGRGRDGR